MTWQDLLHLLERHETLLWWLAGASVVLFLVSLLSLPFIAASIPADYFVRDARPRRLFAQHPAVRAVWLVLKNILGGFLLLAGIALLFLPGQGLVTLFAALVLLDLPGKYRAERWLIGFEAIRGPLNWLRRRRRQPPILHPSSGALLDDQADAGHSLRQ